MPAYQYRKFEPDLPFFLGNASRSLWEPLLPVLANFCLPRTRADLAFFNDFQEAGEGIRLVNSADYARLRAGLWQGLPDLPEPPAEGEYVLWLQRLGGQLVGMLCADTPEAARTALWHLLDELVFPSTRSPKYVKVPYFASRGRTRRVIHCCDYLQSYKIDLTWGEDDWRLFVYSQVVSGSDELVIAPLDFSEWDTGAALLGQEIKSFTERFQWKAQLKRLEHLAKFTGEVGLPLAFKFGANAGFMTALGERPGRPSPEAACLSNSRERQVVLESWRALLKEYPGVKAVVVHANYAKRCTCPECSTSWLDLALEQARALASEWEVSFSAEGLPPGEVQKLLTLYKSGRLDWCKRLYLPFRWWAQAEAPAGSVEVVPLVDTGDPAALDLQAAPLLGEFASAFLDEGAPARPQAALALAPRLPEGPVAVYSSRYFEQFNDFALTRALKQPGLQADDVIAKFCHNQLTVLDGADFAKDMLEVEARATGELKRIRRAKSRADKLKREVVTPTTANEVITWRGRVVAFQVATALYVEDALQQAQQAALLASKRASAKAAAREVRKRLKELERHGLFKPDKVLKDSRLILPSGAPSTELLQSAKELGGVDLFGILAAVAEIKRLLQERKPLDALRLLQLKSQAALGKRAFDLLTPDDLERCTNAVRCLLEAPAPGVAPSLRNALASPDGRPVTCTLKVPNDKPFRLTLSLPWSSERPTVSVEAGAGRFEKRVTLAADVPEIISVPFTPQPEATLEVRFTPAVAGFCPVCCRLSVDVE